ncbi:hypothetical protein XENOCAPTIV_011711, partial [Xenoophorus captivus]
EIRCWKHLCWNSTMAIEEEITRERQVADEVVQAMPSAKREKYFSMTTANDDLLQEFAVLQEELDILVTRKEDYEAELSHSQIKQEMVRLHETLSALEGKRDAMEAEHKSLGSPQEQREKLLKQVKPHTEAGLSSATWFLESFEESKAEELEKLNQSQENIVSLLEHCSRNMLRLRHVDTVTASELKNMQEQDLEKVQQLEGKITEELSTLKEQVSTMESELHTYGDLETLRQTAEDKRKVAPGGP